mgnify:CR=1 FL=1
MSRADIYQSILFYTKRAEEDAETIQEKASNQIAIAFYSERVRLSTNKIQIYIEQLKDIDRKENQENE